MFSITAMAPMTSTDLTVAPKEVEEQSSQLLHSRVDKVLGRTSFRHRLPQLLGQGSLQDSKLSRFRKFRIKAGEFFRVILQLDYLETVVSKVGVSMRLLIGFMGFNSKFDRHRHVVRHVGRSV